MEEQKYKCMLGPDQLIGDEFTNELTTTEPGGAVRIRKYEEDFSDDYPILSVPTMLKYSSEKFSTKSAMEVKRNGKWIGWTYNEYYEQSKIAAMSFIKLGLQRFHSVCILGFNSPEWFISQMGAIMAGGFSVGIYTTNNSDACKHVANDSRANVIVVEDENQLEKILSVRNDLPHLKAIVQYNGTPQIKQFTQENGKCLFVYSWKEFMNLGSKNESNLLTDLDIRLKGIAVNQCCLLIYTSGTTGQPKGVMLSHDNITWLARISNRLLNGASSDVCLSYLPLSHSAAQMGDIWMPMEAGATVYFAERDALKGSLGVTLKEIRPKSAQSPPSCNLQLKLQT